MAVRLLLSCSPKPPSRIQNHSSSPNTRFPLSFESRGFSDWCFIRRGLAVSVVSLALALTIGSSPPGALSEAPPPPSRNPVLAGIANTKSWFQFYGDGFSIRVPPLFEDIMEPEEYTAGFSFYGDKAKPKTFAARFASPDRSEVVTVVIRPTNQLKITFLEAKDITELGTLKEAAKIFVPGGANLFSARTIKIKEDESLRTYYFYEFGIDTQRVALMTSVNSGKAYIAGAAAPENKWDDDGVKLRSAAISLSIV
ncbi:Pentatricopeptide repeat-containing protein [Musa troglodytarum]|uniref:Pentatricopeptide repeat-containing protein n=1 Tax=Musa troglodytarum TaxID=320322 RepID=A0A9E7FZD1_9LILI|nr:Pentatricopeptide repeat-containing protein [Musa troglodytarum]